MRQNVQHAIIREGKLTFAVVAVSDDVATSPEQAANLIGCLSPAYNCPVVLMGERTGSMYGRSDIVRFLKSIHPSQMTWRRGTVDF